MPAEAEVVEFQKSLDPLELLSRLRASGLVRDFLLYRDHGRGETMLALNSVARVGVVGNSVVMHCERSEQRWTLEAKDPFKQVEQCLSELPIPNWVAYGYMGFDLSRFYFDYGKVNDAPALAFVVPEVQIRVAEHSVRLTTSSNPSRWKEIIDSSGAERPIEKPFSLPDPPASDREEYMRRAQKLVGWIREGRLQKAILSRKIQMDGTLDVLGTYASARALNRAARSFCFELGGVRGVGFSPELFLEATRSGHVITNPLAGTRPRGSTSEEDQRAHDELFKDGKEVKEHAMSVRLAQEEMSRVCHAESVRIYDFMDVKQFRCVQHLSSRVSGDLRPGFTTWDAAKTLFPAITVSGVDKAAAVQAIAELEDDPRGVYGGAVGWIDREGAADLCLAIRSVYGYGRQTVLNAGAGIVAESVPEREYVESVNKMKTMASHLVLSST